MMQPILVLSAGDKFSVEIARLFAALLRQTATSPKEFGDAAGVDRLADEFAHWRADNEG